MKDTEINEQGSKDRIAQRAYEIWETKGRPDGKDMECWLEAENQVRGNGRTASNGKNGNRRAVSQVSR